MSIKPSKVGVVGAGNVGGAIANALVLLSKSVTVVLFDRNLCKTEGQAWDINDAIPLLEEMDVIPYFNSRRVTEEGYKASLGFVWA